MTEQTDNRWLIVEPVPTADARVEAVLPELTRRYHVDGYIARQRLIGRGPALLAKGSEKTLAGIADLLAEQGFSCRAISPTPPRFVPQRLFGLTLAEGAISFRCRDEEVVLQAEETVVGILGDLSNHLVEKSLKRLVMQNAYRGADHIVPLAEEEISQAILRGAPVFDAYILDTDGAVRAAVRAFPGRFDPSGLGEKAVYSAVGNLEALVETVRERAGRFILNTDFGLAQLPGCRPKRAEDGGDNRRENLRSLTRYGWLSVDLHRAAPAASGDSPSPSPQSATAATKKIPLVAVQESGGTPSGEAKAAPQPVAPGPGLPPPPEETEETGGFPLLRVSLWGGLLGALIGLLALRQEHLLSPVFAAFVLTGVFPALLAAGCFAVGVRYLLLKRQIEDTPVSRIRSLAMGMVEVRGKAVRLYAVVSPLTQMACVYYRLHRYCRDGNGWRLESTDSSGSVPFALEDETGRITVDPRGAVVHPRTRQEGVPGGSALFSSVHHDSGEEKWVEEIIAEGTPLYILGFARSRRAQGVSLHERTLAILHRYKSDPQIMRRFDADGDGYLSPEEWEAARAAAEEEALAASLAEGDRPQRQQEHAVIGRPDGRSLPFIVAETPSEARLTRNFGLHSALLLGGGVLFFLGAVVLFLRHFNGL